MTEELKQVIVVREDLRLSTGKIAAQVAHASLEAWKNSDEDVRREWENEGGKKVVVKAKDEKKLLEAKNGADNIGLPSSLITDRGHTEVPPGTKTALGIGPASSKKIDKITGSLPLLK